MKVNRNLREIPGYDPNYGKSRFDGVYSIFDSFFNLFGWRNAEDFGFQLEAVSDGNRSVDINVRSDLMSTGSANKLTRILRVYSKDHDIFKLYFGESYKVDLSVPAQIISFSRTYQDKKIEVLGRNKDLISHIFVHKLAEPIELLGNVNLAEYYKDHRNLPGNILLSRYSSLETTPRPSAT